MNPNDPEARGDATRRHALWWAGLARLMTLACSLAVGVAGCGGADGGSASASGGRSAPTFAVGGTVAGLADGPLVLSNGIDRFEMSFADDAGVVKDRPFTVAHLPSGAAYNVHVEAQPAGTSCTVVHGTDVVADADVTDIQVLCVKRKSLSLMAGPLPQYGGLDGAGTDAGFLKLGALTQDAAGNLYAVDNHAIRKITPSGVVSTLAGVAMVSGNADGQGSAARFASPSWLTIDTQGNVYVADAGNDAIRVVSPAGRVSTVAVNAQQKTAVLGTACLACGSIARDAHGNFFLAPGFIGAFKLIKVSPQGNVTQLTHDYAGTIYERTGIALDSAGALYLGLTTQTTNVLIKVAPDGHHTAMAAYGASSSYVTRAISVAPDGAIWLAGRIRGLAHRALYRIDAQGGATSLVYPEAQALDGNDVISLVADGASHAHASDADLNALMSYTSNTDPVTVAGYVRRQDNVNGQGSAARFDFHTLMRHGLAVWRDGSVVVGDDGNGAIRVITAEGRVSTLWGRTTYVPDPRGTDGRPELTVHDYQVAVDGQQAVHVCAKDFNSSPRLFRLGADGQPEALSGGCSIDALVTNSAGRIVTVDAGCIQVYASDGNSRTALVCKATGTPPDASAALLSIGTIAPLPGGQVLVVDGGSLKLVTAAGAVSTLNSRFAGGAIFGDGLGNVGVITSKGIDLLYGSGYALSARILDVGDRTVVGTLPTTAEFVTAAAFRGSQIVLVIGDAVFAVDL